MTVIFPKGREPQTFIGRIESVDRHSKNRLSRFTFVIDAVDERLDPIMFRTKPTETDDRNFAIIRVMTTFGRFSSMADIPEIEPENLVGQWVAISLLPHGKEPGPLAQVCPLEQAGYGVGEKFTVGGISVFGEVPEAPRSLSAAGDRRKQVAAELAEDGRSFRAESSSHESLRLLRELLQEVPEQLLILDVGHANFATVFSTAKLPICHFDVGWPIGFNRHTTNGNPPRIVSAPIVIMSHWDWDHLHGYHVWAELREKTWVAPVQDLGPGALKVARALQADGRLHSIAPGVPSLDAMCGKNPMHLGNCDSSHVKTKAKIRNNSGIFLGLKLASGRLALLPGDADYRAVSWPFRADPDILLVAHHGAAVDGKIQKARAKGNPAIVSMGKGNVYRHPCEDTLRSHGNSGWTAEFTSQRNGIPRDNRCFK